MRPSPWSPLVPARSRYRAAAADGAKECQSDHWWRIPGEKPLPAPPGRHSNRRTRRRAESGWRSGDAWFRGYARERARSFHPAPRIDIAAHGKQVVNAAAQRSLERRNAPERQILVGAGEPAHRARLVGKQQLEPLVDAKQQRDPLQLIARQRPHFATAPIVIGGPRDVAQERAALIDRQPPSVAKAHEQADGGRRHALPHVRVAKRIRGQDARSCRRDLKLGCGAQVYGSSLCLMLDVNSHYRHTTCPKSISSVIRASLPSGRTAPGLYAFILRDNQTSACRPEHAVEFLP